MPCCCSTSPGPTPESSSSCGEATDPLENTTSPWTATCLGTPFSVNSKPRARLPSKVRRSAWAWVRTVRLGRLMAGFRKARAALQRTPLRWFT